VHSRFLEPFALGSLKIMGIRFTSAQISTLRTLNVVVPLSRAQPPSGVYVQETSLRATAASLGMRKVVLVHNGKPDKS